MTLEKIIRRLGHLVAEWHEATDGEQLDDVKAPVKLLFEDICRALNINPELIGL
jgi:hypothetical protein